MSTDLKPGTVLGGDFRIERPLGQGDTSRATQHMRTFIRRYPNSSRTPRYRQFLERHE